MIPQRVPILQGGPDAYLDFDFRFGQEAYWLNRQRYGDFSLVPGATSTGGAGFGTVQRNGVWQSVPANAPLIGDGGLRNAEARTNSIRNPTALNGSVSQWPSNWGTGSGLGGLTVTRIGRVTSANGLPGFAFRVQGTPVESIFRLQFETLGAVAVTPGQTWITSLQTELLAGSWTNVSEATAAHFYRNAGNSPTALATSVARAPSPTGVEDWRTSVNIVAPADTTQAVSELRITMSTTLPSDFTVAVYAPNLKQGPDINDPPILQTSGLAATRTGYGYQETGLNIAPVHYGVARARLVAPLANHAASYPIFLELRPDTVSSRVVWFASKSAGNHRIIGAGSDGVSAEVAPGAAVAGQYYALAWACRAGSLAYSLDGGAVGSFAVSAITSPFSRIGYMGGTIPPGGYPSNAEMDIFATWNGEISNDALQALSARFTA